MSKLTSFAKVQHEYPKTEEWGHGRHDGANIGWWVVWNV